MSHHLHKLTTRGNDSKAIAWDIGATECINNKARQSSRPPLPYKHRAKQNKKDQFTVVSSLLTDTFASACSRSAIKSSVSSIPYAILTKPSEIPAAYNKKKNSRGNVQDHHQRMSAHCTHGKVRIGDTSLASCGTILCVDSAGTQQRDSTPPRLTAIRGSSSACKIHADILR